MAFDIYGERLERGHCEVHPWVHEEYPCPVCYRENDKRKVDDRQAKEYYAAMEQDYCNSFTENLDGAGI